MKYAVLRGVAMIVRQFLQWVRTAPAGERAEATSALARAYLYSDLSRRRSRRRRRRDADAARRSVAAGAPRARRGAGGEPERAAGGDSRARRRPAARSRRRCSRFRRCLSMPIWSMRWRPARRRCRPRSPAAPRCRARSPPRSPRSASAEACLVLLENPDADIAPFSIDRIVERFGHLAAIREPLLARDDLPAATRQALVAKLSETLAGFVAGARMARRGPRAARRARGLREGDGRARRGIAGRRSAPADSPSARERPAHRRPDPARAAVRQRRAVRGGAGRACGHAARARVGPRPRRRHRGLARAVRQGRAARLDLSGVPGGDRGDARGRLHRRAAAAPRGSSAA